MLYTECNACLQGEDGLDEKGEKFPEDTYEPYYRAGADGHNGDADIFVRRFISAL